MNNLRAISLVVAVMAIVLLPIGSLWTHSSTMQQVGHHVMASDTIHSEHTTDHGTANSMQADCLEHCFTAATSVINQQLWFMVSIQLLLFITTAIILLVSYTHNSKHYSYTYWYRPHYQFATIRLLE